MALDKNTGSQVSKDGRKFEVLVKDACADAGYVSEIQHRFYNSRNLYGGMLKVDVFIHPTTGASGRFPNGLIIECSRQNVAGSGDHKLPHKVWTAVECNPCPSVIILDGDGFSPLSIAWAKGMVGKDWCKTGNGRNLLGVFTFPEFLIWIGLSNDWFMKKMIAPSPSGPQNELI